MCPETPSMLIETELEADALLEEAITYCAKQLGKSTPQIRQQLKEGSPCVHSLLRYAIAKRLANYLGQLGGGICGVYLYGSTMNDDAGPCSDIDLVVVVKRKRDQALLLLRCLDLALLTSCRAFIDPMRLPASLLDVHLVDVEEEKNRRGYGAILHSPQTHSVCLWL